MKTCNEEGCQDAHAARGLCSKHYFFRKRNNTLPEKTVRPVIDPSDWPDLAKLKGKGICVEPNCQKPSRARGLCHTHYSFRTRHNSLPDLVRWQHILSNINPEERTATCAVCGPVPISRAGRRIYWQCAKRACERTKLWHRKLRPIGPECEICQGTTRLSWDHDATTGNYRGTLCSNCNTGLGLFKHDAQRLAKAVTYLNLKGATPTTN